MKRYSPQAVIKIARKMGITSNIEPVYSLCLGTPEISLYEMVGAMNTFANKGLYIEPIFVTRIEDKNGNVLETFKPKTNEAISESTAYLKISLLRGVVESGTGARLRSTYKLMNPIAGKTGTTQNNSDGWFMGITPNLVSGLWVGGEDRSIHFRSTLLGQGANMALPIWALYMLKVYADKSLGYPPNVDFDKPRKGLPPNFNCDDYDYNVKPDDIFTTTPVVLKCFNMNLMWGHVVEYLLRQNGPIAVSPAVNRLLHIANHPVLMAFSKTISN